MKAVAILLLCVIACATAQFTCNVRTCVKSGEICNANNTIACRSDSQCMSAGSDTGICMEPPRLGDSCDTISGSPSCESGTTCRTTGENMICGLNAPSTFYLYPGEGCNDDLQCSYSSPYGGDDAIDLCRSGKCHHIKRGHYCTGSNQCSYNSDYCGRDRRCTKYIKSGQPCYFSDETGNRPSAYDGASGCGKNHENRCMPNALNGDAGTCQKVQSQEEGEYCATYTDCKKGLYCITTPGNSFGTCTKPAASSTLNQPCNPLLITSGPLCDRDGLEVCTCTDEGLNKCLPDYSRVDEGAWEKNQDLRVCTRKKGCTGTQAGFTCTKDKCKSQSCSYYKAQRKLKTSNSIACGSEGLCNSAFTLVASPVLALLAFVVFFAL